MMELRNVSKTYTVGPEVLSVLRHVNLRIEEGEYVSLVGPSGSGKSTMMHLMGLLDTPSAGEVWFEGVPVHALSFTRLAHLRNQAVGFVFQNFFLLPRMSAIQNVEVPLMYGRVGKRERKQRAKEALERVGLGDRLLHWPNALSGGQRQRVAIARAIVNRPKVLLADEPTGALDSQTGHEIMALFQDLNQSGVTIVMITHDKTVARRANRMITLQDGRVTHDDGGQPPEGDEET